MKDGSRSEGERERTAHMAKRTKAGLIIAAVVTALALVSAACCFLGCGNDSPSAGNETEAPTEAPASAAAPTEAPASAETPAPTEEPEQRILAVSYGSLTGYRNVRFDIPCSATTYTDLDKKGTTLTLTYFGRSYTVRYRSSVNDVFLLQGYDQYVDASAAEGDKGNYRIELYSDGSLKHLSYSDKGIASLDLGSNAGESAIPAAVVAALGKEVDFTPFDRCEICTGDLRTAYELTWKQQIGGMDTSNEIFVRIHRESGKWKVMILKISKGFDYSSRAEFENIDVESYMPALKERARYLLDGQKCNIDASTARLASVNGEPCIRIAVNPGSFYYSWALAVMLDP